jgi:SAM-dependent methyltransferase
MSTAFGPAFDSEWRTRFERFAGKADTEAGVSGWSDLGLARRLDTFASLVETLHLPRGSAALDLGCGAGTYVRLLADRGHRVVGLDYSVPSLVHALRRDGSARRRYAAGDAYDLPFRRGAFDLVVCIGVLQAVADPQRILDEALRVLRRDGVLVVEALNSRALVARATSAHAALRRLPPRVRTYDPHDVHGWLIGRGVEVMRRVAIVLPPRGPSLLRRMFDLSRASRRLEARPGLTEMAAHSFLFAARKDSVAAISRRREG